MIQSVRLARILGLSGVSILSLAPLIYGGLPLRLMGVNVWLLAGILLTIGFVVLSSPKTPGRSPIRFQSRALLFGFVTVSLVVWAVVILVLRRGEGLEIVQSYAYILSPLLIFLVLNLTMKVPDEIFVIGLRATGVLLGCVVLAVQMLVHVDLVGDHLVLVEPTRQMIFQANSIGTTLAMLMALEAKIATSSCSSGSLCLTISALHMSAILYVDSDASVIFGTFILLWHLASQLKKRNPPKYWASAAGALLLFFGAFKVRISSLWSNSLEGTPYPNYLELSGTSIGLRVVERALDGDGVLDNVRAQEWVSLLNPSGHQFFLGWESRDLTHGNLQLLSSDFGVFFGIVFSFFFALGVLRLQRTVSSKALLLIFCLDSLVTSSFQHLYLCVYFAMISLALDSLGAERRFHVATSENN